MNDAAVPYIATAYFHGITLRDFINQKKQEKQISLAAIYSIGRQLFKAVDIHKRAGIVHRDLKPENILIAEDEQGLTLKIIDYSIARAYSVESDQADPEGISTNMSGTPGYMSPEQLKNETVDYRSDIYTIGLILLEMVAGTRHEVSTYNRSFRADQTGFEIPLRVRSQLGTTFGSRLQKVIVASLQFKKAERISSLEKLIEGEEGDLFKNLDQSARNQQIQYPAYAEASEPEPALKTRAEGVDWIAGFNPPLWPKDEPTWREEFRITIVQEGFEDRYWYIKPDQYLIEIGRGKPFLLLDEHVSRHHVTIYRTGGTGYSVDPWEVENKSATNRVGIRGKEIGSQVRADWYIGDVLRIGPYFLRWDALKIVNAKPTQAYGEVGQPQFRKIERDAKIVALEWVKHGNQPKVELAQKKAGELPFRLTNISPDQDTFLFDVQSDQIPRSWIQFPQEQITLQSQESIDGVIHIDTTDPTFIRFNAGKTKPIRLTVTSLVKRKEIVKEAKIELEVQRFSGELTGKILPYQIIGFGRVQKGIFQVKLYNRGNYSTAYEIHTRDTTGLLKVFPNSNQIEIARGEEEMLEFDARPVFRPRFGRKRTHPIHMEVININDPNQTLSLKSQIEISPRISVGSLFWIIPLCLFICGILTWISPRIYAFESAKRDADIDRVSATLEAKRLMNELIILSTTESEKEKVLIDVVATAENASDADQPAVNATVAALQEEIDQIDDAIEANEAEVEADAAAMGAAEEGGSGSSDSQGGEGSANGNADTALVEVGGVGTQSIPNILFSGERELNVTEGDVINLALELETVSNREVTIEYEITTENGEGERDIATAESGQIIWPAGRKRVQLTLPIVDDEQYETEEMFTITFSNAQNGNQAGLPPVFVTIADDDPQPELSFVASNIEYPEPVGTAEAEYNVVLMLENSAEEEIMVTCTPSIAALGATPE
ncbi:MAG: protein kinase, partial [Chloroflexota bacterium]